MNFEDLSVRQQAWLTNVGSLTHRLRQLTRQQVGFLLEFEKPGCAYAHEAEVLQLGSQETVWHRQIAWQFERQTWVCGRLVVSQATLQGLEQDIRQLGERALGEFLFSQPDLVREPIVCYRVTPDHPYFQLVSRYDQLAREFYWARHSVFRVRGLPLLVAEIFLPQFFEFVEYCDVGVE